jgi:hypothetical protein
MPTSRGAPPFLRFLVTRFVLQVAVGAVIVVGLIALLVACAANPRERESFESTSSALVVSGLFPTGVDAARAPLAVGAVDPHYSLSSDDPSRPGPDALVVTPVAGWTGNTTTSNWISARADSSGANLGNYTFTTTFSLTGVDPTKVSISGSWACDDSCVIRLNGTVVASDPAPAWNTVAAFTIPTGSPFLAGTNTLEFVATNSGGGATGLQVVSISGTSLGCTADDQCSNAQFCNTQTATCTGTLPSGTPIPTITGHSPVLDGVCASGVGEAVCDAGVCDMSNDECGLANGNGPCTAANGATLCQSGACSVNATCEPSGGCNVDGDCAGGQQCDSAHSCVALADAGPDGSGGAGGGEDGAVEAGEGGGAGADASEADASEDGSVGADGSEGEDASAFIDGSTDASAIADGQEGADGAAIEDASARDSAAADAREEDAEARGEDAGEEGADAGLGPSKVLEGDGLSCSAARSGSRGTRGLPLWTLGVAAAAALRRRRRERKPVGRPRARTRGTAGGCGR